MGGRIKRRRYTDEQIAYALRQAESGTPVAEVYRKMGVSEKTFFKAFHPDAEELFNITTDLRKVATDGETRVLDGRGQTIGTVLTCATDMGIGYHEERIFSVASPDRPQGFKPKGLACGFVKVNKSLSPGDEVAVSDQRRKLPVTIVADIRPDRTARRPLKDML